MNTGYNDIDEALLLAYLTGEALTSEEKEQVENWLQEAENREEARETYKAWELSLLSSDRPVDVKGAFKQVKNRIDASEIPPKSKVKRMPQTWWYVAASIALLAVAVVMWNRYEGVDNQQVSVLSDDNTLEYILPDSSKVSVKKGSEIAYEKGVFGRNQKREVKLNGSAYFEVAHNPDKPFIVATTDARITVLGTKFLVEADGLSPTHVLVTEGKVQVHYLESGKVIQLKADEEVIADKEQETTVQASDRNKLYWKTGVMQFDQDTLGTVFQTLHEEFKTPILIEDTAVLSCEITATFKRQSLATIIEVIEKTHGLSSHIKGDTIIIEGHGCQ